MEAVQESVELEKKKIVLPRIVNTTRLLILRHVLAETGKGGSYSAKIASELNINPSWVSRCLAEFEQQGLLESTADRKTCGHCNGTTELFVGNKDTKCIFCVNGIVSFKSYPLFYQVPREEIQKVRSLVYSCMDLTW